jgi:hypothetical protein
MNDGYDTSADTANVALSTEEVDRLLVTDGVFFTRDPRRVVHLLSRVRATQQRHQETLRGLHRDIAVLTEADRHPLQKAVDALLALTPEQRKMVLNVQENAHLAELEQETARASRARAAAASDANRVRFAVSKALAHPGLPAEVDALLRDLLANLSGGWGADNSPRTPVGR